MKKVIIDCDPGHDDAIALLLALHSEDIHVLGVTTVAGNSELKHTRRNARRILDYAGATDIDVYSGCEKPLMRDLFRLTGELIHGEDGLGGPEIPEYVTPIKEEHAVDFIIRTLKESDEKIILIPTGPLTNIATAFIKAPEIKEKVEKIIIMGGAVWDTGNITSAAEFNIYVDPEAAKIVFASGCETYLVSLDVTMKAEFSKNDIEELRAQGDKISVIVAELLDFFSGTHVEHFGFYACPIHDALCVGVLIDESLIEFEHTYLDVSVNDPLTLGETVADLWGITGKPKNCYIAKTVDSAKFAQMIKTYMKKTYISKN